LSTAPTSSLPPGPGWRVWLVTALLFSGIASYVYEPALRGPLVSDDVIVLVNRPWMEELTLANVVEILDPRGEPVLASANWAPAHLLVHLVQRQFFGPYHINTYPYHLTNVFVHGINSALFGALLAAQGVPLAAALLAGAVFLLHPANVEAVAWIFQLKTLLSFTFAMSALLCLVRRPALSTVLFALSILAKPSAGAALAAAIVFEWVREPAPGEPPRRTRWLFAWGGLLVLYSIVEFAAFRSTGEFLDATPLSERGLSVVAILGRYLLMATTSQGLSVFHQPARTDSPLDPYFLLGLVTLIALGFLCVRTLLRRHPAAGWLGFAAASYAPVAQLFAFRFPIADRYLYFVLAGLIGALLVAFAPQLRSSSETVRLRGFAAPPRAWVGAALVLALLLGYGARAQARARVWGSSEAVDRDAIANYPEGVAGQLDRARRAVASGDADTAVAAIEALVALGSDNPMAYLTDPELQPLRGDPRYEALLKRIARNWLEHYEQLQNKAPGFGVVDAVIYYIMIGELDKADALLDATLREPGAVPPQTLEQLKESVRRERIGLEVSG
jgi:hypothetical protein